MNKLLTLSAGILFCLGTLRSQSATKRPVDAAKLMQVQQSQVWTGTLLDADCKAATPDAKCEIAVTTQAFGFQTSEGKYFKLDNEGSSKVRAALEANGKKTGSVSASLSGAMDGDMLKVESVRIL